jgi:protein SCO1/2
MMKRAVSWSLFAVCVLAVPVVALTHRSQKAAALPVYADVPPFQLVDQDGQAFGTADLKGQVWIADFIFTSCSSACPRLTEAMRDLEVHLVNRGEANPTRLVSITVDPERDTPVKLREYADQFGVVGRRWKFLTGPTDRIQKAVVDGFKQGVEKEKDPNAPNGFTILHGTKMVLVDALGRIRGFYDANDHEEMAKLREHISLLLERGGA